MFTDYYKILQVSQTSSMEEIKSSYRKLAMKWHPDKNPNNDTTKKMQDLTIAYYVLKDEFSRKLYDEEYTELFKRNHNETVERKKEDTPENNENFKFSNDDLNDRIKKAKQEAENYLKKTVYEVGTLTKQGVKDAGIAISKQVLGLIVVGIIGAIIFTINSRPLNTLTDQCY